MRKFVQKQILEIIQTLAEGIEFAELNVGNENSKLMLNNCEICIEAIDKTLSKTLSNEGYSEYVNITENIKRMIQQMNECIAYNNTIDEVKQNIEEKINQLRSQIANEEEVKLEIVFMPYKVSMWDCLESIWLSARDDERCNFHVVPIPYYDRMPDGRLGEFHYEGNDMPDYVPIENYEGFNLERLRPDIIYVHNPYEQYNKVTTIDPRFYAPILKKYTDLLIYVPYGIASFYNSIEDGMIFLYPPIMENADYIIYQSDVQLKMLRQSGYSTKKALVLGNPKFDYVINKAKTAEKKETNEKTFLFATTLGVLLTRKDPIEWIDEILVPIFDLVLEKENTRLIWRPHPLTKATISSMRPEIGEYYDEIIKKYSQKPNMFIDNTSDPSSSFALSDAMICDGGSMAFSYIPTGKPIIFYYNQKKKFNETLYKTIDISEIYFVMDVVEKFGYGNEYGYTDPKGDLNVTYHNKIKAIDYLVTEIINGNDFNANARMNAFRASIKNSDGTSGEKIHKKIMEIEMGR